MAGSKRRVKPSVSGLVELRKRLRGIRKSLEDAFDKEIDLVGKLKIRRALNEVVKRIQLVDRALDKVAKLDRRLATYLLRVERSGERRELVLGRTFRGASAWLRRWEKT